MNDHHKQTKMMYQCREIGEGGWETCDKQLYDYCQRSPEMDTRLKPVPESHVEYCWVGIVERMPGAPGFNMVVFDANVVPEGTDVFIIDRNCYKED